MSALHDLARYVVRGFPRRRARGPFDEHRA